jgi:hypothetical protein
MTKHFRLPVEASAGQIRAQLDAMKQAQLKDGPPSAALRRDPIDRAIDLLRSNKNALVEAINADYSCRGRQQTLLADILASIEGLRFNREHLEAWMARPAAEEPFPGVKAHVDYQPPMPSRSRYCTRRQVAGSRGQGRRAHATHARACATCWKNKWMWVSSAAMRCCGTCWEIEPEAALGTWPGRGKLDGCRGRHVRPAP